MCCLSRRAGTRARAWQEQAHRGKRSGPRCAERAEKFTACGPAVAPMHNPKHLRACLWLFFATAIWGISFPFVKAILLAQEQLVPDGRSVFFASLGTVVRFGVAGVLIAL